MKFLEIDSPFMRVLGRIADLMIINFLTILLCIPVITAGAAFTAMHYVLLKIVRDEEGYIVKQYFRSFKENFLQATILWIGMLAVSAALFVDWRIMRMQGDQFSGVMLILLFAAALASYLIMIYIFPVLSRYKNTIRGTLKTSLSMSVLGILTLRTIASAILIPLPFILALLFGYASVPFFVVICFSGPGYLRAMMYSGLFDKYEGKEKNSDGENEETE